MRKLDSRIFETSMARSKHPNISRMSKLESEIASLQDRLKTYENKATTWACRLKQVK